MVGGISGALSRIKDAWSRAAVGASTGLGCASAIGVGLGAGAGFTWRPQPHMQAAHRTHLDPRSRGSTPAPANSRGGCPSSSARWVTKNGYGGKLVLAMDLQRIYPRMCEQLGRSPFAWQQVAEPLKELTGGKKRYEWIRLTPGKRKKDRRRVYLIPGAM